MKTSSFLCWLRAAVVCAAAGLANVYAGEASTGATAKCYIQKGLIAQYDAIDNAGTGVTDPAATVWKDISRQAKGGDIVLTGLTDPDWNSAGYLAYSKSSGFLLPNKMSLNDLTMEIYANSYGSSFRRYDIEPYNSAFESWTTGSEFLERITNTRLNVGSPAYNTDIAFTITYSNKVHVVRRYQNGALTKSNTGTGSSATAFTDKQLYFLKGMSSGGRVYSIRVYDRALSADEIAHNLEVDGVRFFGKDESTVTWPEGYRVNFETHLPEVRLTVTCDAEKGTVTLGGEPLSEDGVCWVPMGVGVTFEVTPKEGFRFVSWLGDVAADDYLKTSFSMIVEAPTALTARFNAADAYDERCYVQDGLIALWDGINNANRADGAHDSSAKTWVDLCGGESWALTASAGWTADFALNCPGTTWAAKRTAVLNKIKTADICYLFDSATAKESNVIFSSGQRTGGYSCYYGYTSAGEAWLMVNRGKVITAPANVFQTVATTYDLDGNYSKTATGTYLSGLRAPYVSGATDYWDAGMNAASLGGRTSGSAANFKGKIYAVRLYNRDLTAEESAWNAIVDKVRYLGQTFEEAIPDGLRIENGVYSWRITAAVDNASDGKVSVNGGAAALSGEAWAVAGDGTVTLTAFPAPDRAFAKWTGDTDGLAAADLTNPTLTLTDIHRPRHLVATFKADYSTRFDITVPSKAGVNVISAYDEFGAAVALNSTSGSAAKLFSNKDDASGFNPNIKYNTKANYPNGIFIEYDTLDDAYVIKGYSVQTRTGGNQPGPCAPKSWTFWGSPDAEGDNWVLLDTRTAETGWDASQRRYYAITCGAEDAAKAYRRFKWNFTAQNGGSDFFCNLNQLEIFTTEHYFVEGDPVRYGKPSPDYGHYRAATPVEQLFSIADVLTTDEVDGQREWRLDDGIRALYAGWTYVDGETVVASDLMSETTAQVVQPGLRTFTWHFQPVQNRLVLTAGDGGKVIIEESERLLACTNWFAPSAKAWIRAVADSGYEFLAWGGALSDATDPSSASTYCTMEAPHEISAIFVSTQHDPVDISWVGTGEGAWNDPANWNLHAVPGYGDRVFLTNFPAAVTIKMEGAVPHLTSLTVGGETGKTVTLRTSGWMTKIDADEVLVGKNGTITCAGTDGVRPFPNEGPSNRVWIVCQNLTIDKGGVIDVDSAGWGFNTTTATGNGAGPGGGPVACGGAYGGYGGVSGVGTGEGQGYGYMPRPYGDLKHPRQPGSAGGRTNTGYVHGAGGAVLVEATGHVTVDGTITAVGNTGSNTSRGTCSGGGIEIDCETISGSGTVRAPSAGNGSPTGLGGGGRIAVHYNVAQQKLLEKPTISFDVSSGTQYARNEKALQYHNSSQNRGECGTVYFPDDQLLHCDPINVSGQIYMDEPKWSVPSLGIYDRTVMFPQDGFELTVAGNVVISGGVTRAAALYVGGARLVTFATNRSGGENGFRRCGWTDEPCRFTVGGSLHLGRFAECVINSAATDATLTDVPNAAYVDVRGTIRIDTNAAFWCSSHPYLGGSPRITCRKLIVAKGGKITASGEGYLGGLSATGTWGPAWYDASIVGADVRTDEYGFGPGAVRGVIRAGCHGGFASSVSDPKWLYGNEKRPCMPGSGGGGAIGGVGGGVVWVEASRAIEIYGTVSSDGWKICGSGNQGAGGSVFLSTRRLAVDSASAIVARGTDGGGGGRIALWRVNDAAGYLQGDELFAKPLATSSNASGGNGTVYFAQLPRRGLQVILR